MTDRQQRIQRTVDHYAQLLGQLDEPPTRREDAPDSHLSNILRRAGYRRMGPVLLQQIEGAFRAGGIATFPSLTEPSNTRETRIYFFLKDAPADLAPERSLFNTEKQLETFLVENFQHLSIFNDLRLRRRQYPLGQGQKIDLLCEERSTGRLVGVELKHREADAGLATQMRKYMRALTALAKKEKRSAGARGMVITGQPTPDIEANLRTLCMAAGFEVDWRYYKASLTLSPSPGWA